MFDELWLILPAGSILGLSHAVERSLLSIPLGPANATFCVVELFRIINKYQLVAWFIHRKQVAFQYLMYCIYVCMYVYTYTI